MEHQSNLRFNSLEDRITALVNTLAPKFASNVPSFNRKPVKSTSIATKNFNSGQQLQPIVKYQCDNCAKSFGSMQMLTDHMKAKHKDAMPP